MTNFKVVASKESIEKGECMKNTGKEYEELAQQVFDEIINENRNELETIQVQRNVTLQGKDTKHQIDVYWEFVLGNLTYKTIIQAKDQKSAITQPQMLTFKSVIEDLPGTTGVFVTRTGYQAGAKQIADKNGIVTFILREPNVDDWEGYIRVVNIDMHLRYPVVKDIRFVVDGNWANANGITELHSQYYAPSEMNLITPNGEQNFEKLIRKICEEIGLEERLYEQTYSDDTYMRFGDDSKWKILGFSGVFGMREYVNTMSLDAMNFVSHVLENLNSGETRMFKKPPF